MCTVREMRERVEALKSAIIQIAGECMLEEKEQIVGLLVAQQYNEGVDSSNTPLRPYSPPYFKHKQLAGLPTKTNLNETGEFQSTMELRVNGDEYEIQSPSRTDEGEYKSDWLDRWNESGGGSDVMTLTQDNKSRVFPIIEESFVIKLRERLGI